MVFRRDYLSEVCDHNSAKTPYSFYKIHSIRYHAELQDNPCYSQDGKGKNAVCCAIFALGGIRWFILEGETEGNDTVLFGIVIGLAEDEYGYVSLNELSEVEVDLTAQGLGKLRVRQQPNFQPTRLDRLNDHRLQHFLARFED